MTKEELSDGTQNSITRGIDTPCGKLYLTIVYKPNPDNKIDYFRIQSEATRTNECGGSFFEVFSDALTFMIRRVRNEHELKAIVKMLHRHRCNKTFAGKPLSCGDAIARLLMQELNITIKDGEYVIEKEIPAQKNQLAQRT